MGDLPISVVVPFSPHRDAFFYRFCLPSIEANRPAEIIVEEGSGSAPVKRNRGADKAREEYLFFCDDDSILAGDCLKRMYEEIEGKEAGFSYSHYMGVVNGVEMHPIGRNFVQKSQPFDFEALQKNNYIDTMSLLKREYFPRFDEELAGYQDWDLWLRIAKSGVKGQFIDEVLFLKFYFDKGISSDPLRHGEAKRKVIAKHGLVHKVGH